MRAPRGEGRHRYYRLASREVAEALEALGAIATAPPPARSLSPARSALRAARTCYDHLAGAVAVAFAQLLEHEGILRAADERTYTITGQGAAWLAEVLGIDVDALARGHRALARRCLDWTERRPHLAGALGAAVLERLVASRWIATNPGSRAVRITTRGQAGLASLGLRFEPLALPS